MVLVGYKKKSKRVEIPTTYTHKHIQTHKHVNVNLNLCEDFVRTFTGILPFPAPNHHN